MRFLSSSITDLRSSSTPMQASCGDKCRTAWQAAFCRDPRSIRPLACASSSEEADSASTGAMRPGRCSNLKSSCSGYLSFRGGQTCRPPCETVLVTMANNQIKLVAVTRMMKSLVLKEFTMRLPSFGIPNRVRFRSPAYQVLRASYGCALRRCCSLFLPATRTGVPPACPLTGLCRDDP